MSVNQPGDVAYGFSQALIGVPNKPVLAQRDPTQNDKTQIGTIWINQVTNGVFIITSIVDNVATWIPMNSASSIQEIITNSGNVFPVSGVINAVGGSNINTSGAGDTLTINLNNDVDLPATNAGGTQGVYQIGGTNFLFGYGPTNTFVGGGAGNTSLTVGSATSNTGAGSLSLSSLTTGSSNSALGLSSLTDVTTGEGNVALGYQALHGVITGDVNIAIGADAGSSYTTDESSNILIGNAGVALENNTIRIGTQGAGLGEQDACYIAGVAGISPGGTPQAVIINPTTGQLGSTAISAGGIVTLDGDTGSATGATVDLAGGHNITTAATGSTVTLNVSGTTAHAVQIGNATNSLTSLGVGTTGQVLIGSTGADPAFGSLGVNSGLTAHGLLLGQNNSAITALGNATNGQIPIGSTGADPVLATITAGSNITVTNGAGSITIASSGGGGGITTIDGDTGSATGSTVTFGGTNAGASVLFEATGATVDLYITDTKENIFLGLAAGNNTLSGTENVALGRSNLLNLTSGLGNVAVGYNSMVNAANTNSNVAIGSESLLSLTGSSGANISIGASTLASLTNGGFNTVVGHEALVGISTGSSNIAIGFEAGASFSTSDSSNIAIGNAGSGGVSDTIYLGTFGTHTNCYIAGIAGVTVASSAAVLINTTNGELGTIVSSRRYKENIADMDDASAPILNMRPVTFTYKNDSSRETHYGLIAEEVDEVMPHLVAYSRTGEPETVRYHEMPALLLNELQRQHAIIVELSRRLDRLETRGSYESKA